MGRIYGELRHLTGEASLSWDIAHHLYARHMQGLAVIVADNPANLLASVRKQWLKVCRRLLKERSKTLVPERILEINFELERMRKLRFTINGPPWRGGVFIVAPGQADERLPQAFTVYITCHVNREVLRGIIRHMPHHGLVVVYDDDMAELLVDEDSRVG